MIKQMIEERTIETLDMLSAIPSHLPMKKLPINNSNPNKVIHTGTISPAWRCLRLFPAHHERQSTMTG
ncbi:hypothetical protein P7M02_24610, partial [Vibrio parahaemolyticus]|nr:hypothetical protein [Vibrio parahaemolyticus]